MFHEEKTQCPGIRNWMLTITKNRLLSSSQHQVKDNKNLPKNLFKLFLSFIELLRMFSATKLEIEIQWFFNYSGTNMANG